MFEYKYGGKSARTQKLTMSDDMLVVRARGERAPREAGKATTRNLVRSLHRVTEYADFHVAVLRTHEALQEASKEAVLEQLKEDRGLRFAGNCLCDPVTQRPVVYTENVFVRFAAGITSRTRDRLLRKYKLTVKRPVGYLGDAYFVAAPEGIGRDVFDVALTLLSNSGDVELCHPELLRERHYKVAFPEQWHLRKTLYRGSLIDAHANVEAAWNLSEGANTTIAVIDDGVDVDHVEFRALGGVVAPWDATRRSTDPRPKFHTDNHGTACAGVACASGFEGAAGVAPRAALMPIRLNSGLGSQDEADAIAWAAQHGADVISCSWGPQDGNPRVPSDPRHHAVSPLPDSTRLAIEFAANQGRNGLGCVICWAAGNGNESVDLDGYASNEHVIAVGASNDQGRRSAYSDFGNSLWCVFPSDDLDNTLTDGIWTTDRIGSAGYNPGNVALEHPAGNYTNDFGGTSSACPGVAGAAALMLAANPELDYVQVSNLLADTADKIDVHNAEYDAQTGHSPLYGFGRVNCAQAVKAAADNG